MYREQKIRLFLFCLSIAVFFAGSPLILSFALGYKFDPRSLKFTKTGLIFVKTQPLGAAVYLGDRELPEKTPCTIGELLPGKYHLKVALKGHYPWSAEVNVERGRVSRFDKIILFSILPNVKQISQGRPVSYWFCEKKGLIYYISQDDNCVYKTDVLGETTVEAACLPQELEPPLNWALSPNKQKLICYSRRKIAVIYADAEGSLDGRYKPFILKVSDSNLKNVNEIFWHSDSYHLVVVTDSDIMVMEARPNSSALKLVDLDKYNSSVYYNTDTDTLYFSDTQKAADGKLYDNIYKLDLNTRLYLFRDLIKLRQNGYEPRDKKGF